MKYKAIFFDADGVLVKNRHLFSEQLEKDFGIKKEIMTPFFTGVYSQCSLGKADLKKELTKVVDDWGWKGTVDELLAYWFSVGTEIEKDVVGFIKELKEQGAEAVILGCTDLHLLIEKSALQILDTNKILENSVIEKLII